MRFLSLVLSLSLLLQMPVAAILPPSDEEIQTVLDSRPELIFDMVRKLYVLERAEPEIQFPGITIVELVEEGAEVVYDGPMILEIGDDPFNLSYEITLHPTSAIIARDESGFSMSPWWVPAAFGLGFVVGLSAGIYVATR